MHRTCSWLFGISASILEESDTNVYMYNVKNDLKTVSKNFSILCDNFCQFCSHVYTRVVLVKLFEIWTLRCLLEVGVIQ